MHVIEMYRRSRTGSRGIGSHRTVAQVSEQGRLDDSNSRYNVYSTWLFNCNSDVPLSSYWTPASTITREDDNAGDSGE